MNSLPRDICLFETRDGSPTLAFRREDGYVEKMHHTGGALSESLYIYHHALIQVLDLGISAPRALSVGLGLAYNEMITVAECRSRGIADFEILSFESRDWLREIFVAWSEGSGHHDVTDRVAELVAGHFGLEVETLRTAVRTALAEGRLQIRGPFPSELDSGDLANLVYYDAYSSKMNPDLWSEALLVDRLGPHLDSTCVLSTYAATGTLNRALAHLGFRRLERAGFEGKRQCTLAIRRQFI